MSTTAEKKLNETMSGKIDITEIPEDAKPIDIFNIGFEAGVETTIKVMEEKGSSVIETIERCESCVTPKRIIHNWKTDETTVYWMDGKTTKVKPMEGTKHSAYAAFTAALAKKVYGNNTKVRNIVSMTEEPKSKKKNRNKKRDEFLLDKCIDKIVGGDNDGVDRR